MAKLNKDYTSVYNYILDYYFPDSLNLEIFKENSPNRPFRYSFPFQDRVYQRRLEIAELMPLRATPYRNLPKLLFSPDAEEAPDEDILQLMGGFHPLLDMRKDYVDAFKGYKTYWHIFRDFAQPLFGVGNILKALFSLSLAPIIFVMENLLYPYRTHEDTANYIQFFGKSFNRFVSWLVDGVCSAVRGLTQVLFTPFMPLKIISRLSRDKVAIEDNPGLRLAIREALVLRAIKPVLGRAEDILGIQNTVSKPVITKAVVGEEEPTTKIRSVRDALRRTAAKAKEHAKKSYDTLKYNTVCDEADCAEVQAYKEDDKTTQSARKLLATLYDIHRKANKAMNRGQSPNSAILTQERELEVFETVLPPALRSAYAKAGQNIGRRKPASGNLSENIMGYVSLFSDADRKGPSIKVK